MKNKFFVRWGKEEQSVVQFEKSVYSEIQKFQKRDLNCLRVGVKSSNILRYIQRCCAVFTLGGKVVPILKQGDPAPVDIVISDDGIFEKNKQTIILNEERVISQILYWGDISIFDGVKFWDINKSTLKNTIDFHRQYLDGLLERAKIQVNSIEDLGNFIWLLPLATSHSITFEIGEFSSEEADVVILPLKHIGKISEKSKAIVTFGDELIGYEQYNKSFENKEMKWINYFGFPYIQSLSAVKYFGFDSMEVLHHEIRPLPKSIFKSVNKLGMVQPNNVTGTLVVESTLNDVFAPFMVKQIGKGQTVFDGYPLNYFNVNGLIENVSWLCEHLKTQFFLKDDVFYYVGNNSKSVFQIEKEINSLLKIKSGKLKYVKVPYIKRDFNGDIALEKMQTFIDFNSDKQRKIINSLMKQNIKVMTNTKFSNTSNAVDEYHVKSSLMINDVIESNKLSIIDSGELNFSNVKYKNLTEMLTNNIDSKQIITCISSTGEKVLTIDSLYKRATKIAYALKKLGVKEKSHVIFQINDIANYLETFWACILLGAVSAPLAVANDYGENSLNSEKLKNVFQMLDDAFVICTEELVSDIESILEEKKTIVSFSQLTTEKKSLNSFYNWNEVEPCSVFFTSGSTGKPKGVMLNQKNILSRTISEQKLFLFSNQDVDLNWMTLTHAAGLIWTHIRDIYLGINQIQVDSMYILEKPIRWLDLLDRFKASISWAPNFAYALISNEMDNFSDLKVNLESVKILFATAEPNVSKNLRDFLMKLNKLGLKSDVIVPCFGMTETSSVIIYNKSYSLENSDDYDKFVPIGIPSKGHIFRITNSSGEIVNEGVVGNLEGQGPTISTGYYNNELVNKESFTRDGFFRTGDFGVY